MDFRKTEKLLIEQLLQDLYAKDDASYDSRLLLWLRMATGQLLPPFINPQHKNNYQQIVEIGCGQGFTCNYLSLLYPNTQVIGIDLDPRRIAVAQQTVGHRRNIAFYTTDDCADVDLDCDLLLMNHLLWRLDNAQRHEALLKRAAQWLRPEGELAVRALHPRSHWFKGFSAGFWEYMLSGESLTTISKSDLSEFLKELGYSVSNIQLSESHTNWLAPQLFYRGNVNQQQPQASNLHKPYASGLKQAKPLKEALPETLSTEYDDVLGFIFSRNWDDLKV